MDLKEMEKKALTLNPADKAKLITKLLTSLDKPDAEIETRWRKEAERRVDAVKAGTLTTKPLHEILRKYTK